VTAGSRSATGSGKTRQYMSKLRLGLVGLVPAVGGTYGHSRDAGSGSIARLGLGVVKSETGPQQWIAVVQRKGRVWRLVPWLHAASCVWVRCAGMRPLRSSATQRGSNAFLGFYLVGDAITSGLAWSSGLRGSTDDRDAHGHHTRENWRAITDTP